MDKHLQTVLKEKPEEATAKGDYRLGVVLAYVKVLEKELKKLKKERKHESCAG